MRWLLILVGFGTTALIVVAWFVGSWLVAPARSAIGVPPADMPCEVVAIESDSGATLAGWYAPVEAARATVVLLHPWLGSRLSMLGRARLLRRHAYSVLLIDLQAHGESDGEAITFGYREREDARAAVAFARKRNPGSKVAVLGVSLGGAAALLASPLGIEALIVESVYPTIEEAVENRVRVRLGWVAPLASRLLLLQLGPRLGVEPADLRPIDSIAQAGCPLLVLSGALDLHTTAAESERLFASALAPKQLVLFEGAAHRDLALFAPERYAAVVLGFLERSLR